jgi:flavin-binding protein dodecin
VRGVRPALGRQEAAPVDRAQRVGDGVVDAAGARGQPGVVHPPILAPSGERHRSGRSSKDRPAASAGHGRSEDGMAGTVARVTEITARSDTSFEDAIRVGISRAGQTVRNITGAWVKEQKVEVSGGEIVAWQVDLQVTFVLDD